MDALRGIHAVLVPGGLVVDTQPLSPRPPVLAGDEHLGTLDMRAWRATIGSVDDRVAQVVADRLFAIERETRFVVVDTYDNGPELVDTVSGWQGTRISQALAGRVTRARPPITVHQDVRLRLLRARPRP